MALDSSPTVASCLFPGVGKRSEALKRPLSVKVELERLDMLQAFLVNEGGVEALSAVMRATWASLLHCYTGLENICFGVEGGAFPSQTGAGDQRNPMQAVSMHIREDMSFSQLVAHARDLDHILTTTNDAAHYNTSILMRFASHGAEPGQNQALSKAYAMSETVFSLEHLTLITPKLTAF